MNGEPTERDRWPKSVGMMFFIVSSFSRINQSIGVPIRGHA
jgi:hypothetical protein